MTPKERQEAFHIELKELLNKYKAELTIYDANKNQRLVVDFEWNKKLYDENGDGITPRLDLGTFIG